jgi:hypothetical protein
MKPASSNIQKIILAIGIGTIISIAGGIFFAGKSVQKFDDKLDNVISVVVEYKAKTDEKIGAIEKDASFTKRDLSKIKECIAAHTGKTIDGGRQ